MSESTRSCAAAIAPAPTRRMTITLRTSTLLLGDEEFAGANAIWPILGNSSPRRNRRELTVRHARHGSRPSHIYVSCNILRCMKTTVELSDGLLRQAKRLALKERTTVRALIEQGLRAVVADRTRARGFTLRRASFRGDGLVSGRSLQDWAAIRDLVYSERGA